MTARLWMCHRGHEDNFCPVFRYNLVCKECFSWPQYTSHPPQYYSNPKPFAILFVAFLEPTTGVEIAEFQHKS